MDAPECRICGKKHWSRVCDGDDPPRITVTPRVTSRDAVTKDVTKRDASVTPAVEEIVRLRTAHDMQVTDLQVVIKRQGAEIERLECEVMHLKKMLADQHERTVPVEERNRIAVTKKPPPMTAVERQRLHREKQRKAAAQNDGPL